MEFSFEYYSWLQQLDSQPGIMAFVASFGMFFIILGLVLLLWIMKKAGLKKMTNWQIWNDILFILTLSFIVGFFLVMIFLFLVPESDHGGIRLFLIWMTIVIAIAVFYTTEKGMFAKWIEKANTDTPPAKSKTKKKK